MAQGFSLPIAGRFGSADGNVSAEPIGALMLLHHCLRRGALHSSSEQGRAKFLEKQNAAFAISHPREAQHSASPDYPRRENAVLKVLRTNRRGALRIMCENAATHLLQPHASTMKSIIGLHAARKYNEMWMHRKVELAEELLSPGFVSQDFITGRVMDGRDAVVEVIRQVC
jgi:hypothetical protein